jgi:hypothetical protein
MFFSLKKKNNFTHLLPWSQKIGPIIPTRGNCIGNRGIFIFGGGNKRLRNVTKMYCQCQISHKRRKKECLGKFKFSLNRLKKQILRKTIFVSASKGKVILI